MEFFDGMVIRGVRILEQLNEAEQLDEVSTVPQLDSNIRRAWPDTRKRQNATGEVTIGNVEYIQYVGTKMLHARSTSQSNGNAYQQAVQFMNVVYEPADTRSNATFTATNGQDYHIQPIQLNKQNVKVRCSCMDFRFRFANYNSADKSLVGRPPPPYIRKTDTRPPVNPMQVPGMCKHLLKLMQTLRGVKLIR